MKFIVKGFSETPNEIKIEGDGLGGFAENPKVLDGTEESFNSFNFCLADSYISAFYGEEFYDLGELSHFFIQDFMYWANFHDDREKEVNDILTGEFKTYKNRSFNESIIKNNNQEYANLWLSMSDNYSFNFHPMNKKLLLFYLMGDDVDYKMISNNLSSELKTKDEYIVYLKDIVKSFKEITEKESSKEVIIQVLEKLKLFLYNIEFDKSIGNIKRSEVDIDDFVKINVLKLKS